MKYRIIEIFFLIIFTIYAAYGIFGILKKEYGISLFGFYYVQYGMFVFLPIYLILIFYSLKRLKVMR